MKPTSFGLLERLRVAGDGDWLLLQEIYQPLIARRLGRAPGPGDEAADLAQEVLVVVREVADFERRREGYFRSWLRQLTINKIRTYRRRRQRRPVAGLDAADGFLDRLEDPGDDMARE